MPEPGRYPRPTFTAKRIGGPGFRPDRVRDQSRLQHWRPRVSRPAHPELRHIRTCGKKFTGSIFAARNRNLVSNKMKFASVINKKKFCDVFSICILTPQCVANSFSMNGRASRKSFYSLTVEGDTQMNRIPVRIIVAATASLMLLGAKSALPVN
jgi:hypothetical protein